MILFKFLSWFRKRREAGLALEREAERLKSWCADSIRAAKSGDKACREILIQSHVVEKGLSHKHLKPLFGRKRLERLALVLGEYLKHGGRDPYVIGLGMSALQAYNECNRGLGVDNADLIPVPTTETPFHRVQVGARTMSKQEFFLDASAGFSRLCRGRHSLRLYDCKSLPVDPECLLECVATAQNCPNACNRQGVRVKAVLDRKRLEGILAIHRGSTGFGENAAAILAVTADLSFYSLDERQLALVDCGIFTMNLVYALFERHLGTCVLNCTQKSQEEEKRMRTLLSLPDKEVIAALVAVSNIPDGETVRVACSERRDVKEVVQVM